MEVVYPQPEFFELFAQEVAINRIVYEIRNEQDELVDFFDAQKLSETLRQRHAVIQCWKELCEAENESNIFRLTAIFIGDYFDTLTDNDQLRLNHLIVERNYTTLSELHSNLRWELFLLSYFYIVSPIPTVSVADEKNSFHIIADDLHELERSVKQS